MKQIPKLCNTKVVTSPLPKHPLSPEPQTYKEPPAINEINNCKIKKKSQILLPVVAAE